MSETWWIVVALMSAAVGAVLVWLVMRAAFAARVATLQATLDGERRHALERQQVLENAESRLKDACRAMSG
ncbi:MAG: hypothetical protein ABIT38_17460, partial [Gemmatimonadaceae bacterium]